MGERKHNRTHRNGDCGCGKNRRCRCGRAGAIEVVETGAIVSSSSRISVIKKMNMLNK